MSPKTIAPHTLDANNLDGTRRCGPTFVVQPGQEARARKGGDGDKAPPLMAIRPWRGRDSGRIPDLEFPRFASALLSAPVMVNGVDAPLDQRVVEAQRANRVDGKGDLLARIFGGDSTAPHSQLTFENAGRSRLSGIEFSTYPHVVDASTGSSVLRIDATIGLRGSSVIRPMPQWPQSGVFEFATALGIAWLYGETRNPARPLEPRSFAVEAEFFNHQVVQWQEPPGEDKVIFHQPLQLSLPVSVRRGDIVDIRVGLQIFVAASLGSGCQVSTVLSPLDNNEQNGGLVEVDVVLTYV